MPMSLNAREHLKLDLAVETLRCFGTVHLKAWGTSMVPAVWPGDLLTIQSAAQEEVVAGDIVLVLRSNRFFIHRLMEKRQDQDCVCLITKGDAMPHSDPPATESELLGRVTVIRRAHRSLVPSRRISLVHSALAWMVCHSGRFRNVTLRIHTARLHADPMRSKQFFPSAPSALREIPDLSASPASHL
jgi:signal peptidase I